MIRNIARWFFMPLFTFVAGPAYGAQTKTETATFAGGCFWCLEAAFEQVDGVRTAVSGYTGGQKENPTYEEVCSGRTGHLEAVRVTYDPARVSYAELLNVFWKSIDPTDKGGQFADRGSQYGTAIFYHNQDQKRLAEESRDSLQKSGLFEKTIATGIRREEKFYPAEEYHQDYYRKNAQKYQFYKSHSGRERYVSPCAAGVCPVPGARREPGKGEASAGDLKLRLNPLQFHVTQECGTETPFANEYWDNKREGIYVDVVSGEVLFSSRDKFDSGTGWPSFTRPLKPENMETDEDTSHGMARTEVRSRQGRSHLGHVFDDGPAPTGRRYCINSAALRFIPREDLEKEGYGQYLKSFEKQ